MPRPAAPPLSRKPPAESIASRSPHTIRQLPPAAALDRSAPSRTPLALAAILLLAASLRLYDPGLSEFKYDEARVFSQAKALSLDEPFPLTTDAVSIGI
ncbi:MAG: hypothetical protein ACE5NC_09790, partial [Anaerolineae bacterium]